MECKWVTPRDKSIENNHSTTVPLSSTEHFNVFQLLKDKLTVCNLLITT